MDLNFNALPIRLNRNDSRKSPMLFPKSANFYSAYVYALVPMSEQSTRDEDMFPLTALEKFITGASQLLQVKSVMLL
jgi:hypothetical protein